MVNDRPSVLIVDGDRDSLQLYTRSLSRAGFRTSGVTETTTAFSVACAVQPDAVIADLALSRQSSGLDLVRSLRRHSRTAATRIVMISGRTCTADIRPAIQAGCDVFLGKPCLPDELTAVLRELLNPPDVPRVASSRIRAEYQEMPGMRLTAPQVERLCGVSHPAGAAALSALVREGFLFVGPDGTYARPSDVRDRSTHLLHEWAEAGRFAPAWRPRR